MKACHKNVNEDALNKSYNLQLSKCAVNATVISDFEFTEDN